MEEKLLTGVVYAGETPVIFSAKNKDYEFCFMTNLIRSRAKNNQRIKIPTNDGFIVGKLHNGHPIAIHLGNVPFEIWDSGYLNTSTYVRFASNISQLNPILYDGISFTGGTLNRMFFKNALGWEYEDSSQRVKYLDDSIKFDLTEEHGFKITIQSSVQEYYGVYGNGIKNDDVVLTLQFVTPQPLSKIFDHYDKIKELISFMTYRKNVDFDSIQLMNINSNHGLLSSFADVYMKCEYKETEKRIHENICFDEIGDKLPTLINLIWNNDENNRLLSFGFLPENDNDVYYINNTKVRAVCSNLESELQYRTDILVEENQIMEELISEVKKTIKEFRKRDKVLSNDDYNFISSNIKHWSLTLNERLCALYDIYEQELENLNYSSIRVNHESIKKFVKFRNDITHGSHKVVTPEIATTTYILSGLVYMCILERIGMEREKIKEICKRKLLK